MFCRRRVASAVSSLAFGVGVCLINLASWPKRLSERKIQDLPQHQGVVHASWSGGRFVRFQHANTHSRTPAMQAVMKAARVPPSIARTPRRARSLRRSGAIPPIPPNWIPMELKLANPQSA